MLIVRFKVDEGFDPFCPIGPCIATDIDIGTLKNSVVRM